MITDESTRRLNSLMYQMKNLYDRELLTSFQYLEFKKLVFAHCKQQNLIYNEKENQVQLPQITNQPTADDYFD